MKRKHAVRARKATAALMAGLMAFWAIPAAAYAEAEGGGDLAPADEPAALEDGGGPDADPADEVASDTDDPESPAPGSGGADPAGGPAVAPGGTAAGVAGIIPGLQSDSDEAADEAPEPLAIRASGPRKVVRPAEPTHTYVFHDGSEVVETTVLRGGDAVVAADGPAHPGKRFDGWFADEACSQRFEFGGPAPGDGGTTHLYAGFTDVHYFTYYDEQGKVIETEIVELGQRYTLHAQWPAFELDSDTARNDGWEDQDGNRYADLDIYPTGQEVTVTGDLDLKPVVQEGFYVHFHSQGGSATVSQFVHENGKVARPADPTRQGYSFDGWYDAAEDGNAFDFDETYGQAPTGPVEVYAHWIPSETEYAVVFWVQDADDGEQYTIENSYKKRGVTGQETALDDADKAYAKFPKDGADCYFVNEEKSSSVTIRSDGSSVMNVYCDRVYYTLVQGSNQYTVRWGQNMRGVYSQMVDDMDGGVQYLLGRNNRTIIWWRSAQDTYPKFFDPAELSRYASQEVPCGDEITLTKNGSWTGSYEVRRYIYLETLDSSGEDEGRRFDEPGKRTLFFNALGQGCGVPVIEGFTFLRANPENGYYGPSTTDDSGTYQLAEQWFTRNKHDINFHVSEGSDVPSVKNVFFEAAIDGCSPESYVVGETVATDENGVRVVFQGWYQDAAAVALPFSFDDATMPDQDLNLYAKWVPETHDVAYDPAGGEMQDADASLTVPYGTRLEEPADPVRHGYRFVDWHLVDPDDPDDAGTPFVFGSPVTSDMVLRAHWTSDQSHTIVYNAGEGTGSVPSIGSYRSGATGRAQSGDALVPPAGKRFAYWLAADGVRYYPGELVPVGDADVVLTAVYSPEELTGLTYDLNYAGHGIASPCGYETVAGPDGLPVNSTVELREPTAAETPTGWVFAGWHLDAACSGNPVTSVLVDALFPAAGLLPQATASQARNVVYAKWLKEVGPTDDETSDESDAVDPGRNPEPDGGAGATPEPEPEPEPEKDALGGGAAESATTKGSPSARRAASGQALPGTGDGLAGAAGLCALAALSGAATALASRRPRGKHARR